MRLRSGSAACHDVRMIKRYFDCVAWCYRFRVSICQRLTVTARGVLPFVYSGRHHRSFTGWTKLGQFDRILKKSKLGLASRSDFPYISFLRKGTAERSDAVIGMSSNGRTADSGSVNGGSTPSIPANVCPLQSSRPVRLAVQDAALSRRRSPVRIRYGLPSIVQGSFGSLFHIACCRSCHSLANTSKPYLSKM